MGKQKLEDTQFYRFAKIYLDFGTAFIIVLIVYMAVEALLGKGFFSVIITLVALVVLMLYWFKINQRFLKFVLLAAPLNYIFVQNLKPHTYTLGVTVVLLAPVLLYLYAKYFHKPNNNNPVNIKNVTRGTNLFEDLLDTELEIKKSLADKKICFAGVTMNPNAEARHFVALGATGTGKSTAIKELIFTAQARNDRMVITDPDFSYHSSFAKHGDILLNPFDDKSANWDYLGEIEHPSDYQFLASMIIPVSPKDDEWRGFARQLFASVSEGYKKRGLGTSKDFFNFITTAKGYELAVLCEGTSSARFFEPDNEKMLGSILGTLVPFVEPLKYLGTVEGRAFSIRQWVRSNTGSLFIPYKANQVAALRSLISAWFALAVNETLSLEPSDTRKVWFVVDELDALGKIDGLKDALVRIRKFGGRVVLGFQSISQLQAVYGDNEANTIIENCGNKLILRCDGGNNGGTAEFASRMIGDREIEITSISVSNSTSSSKQGGSNDSSSKSWSKSERVERTVLASEISQVPDLNGYMKVANNENWFKIHFQHVDFSKYSGLNSITAPTSDF